MKVEIKTVHRNEFWQQHRVKLSLPRVTVAEHETALLARMGVQVDIDSDLARLALLLDRLFDSPNRWLVLRAGIQIVPVEILGESIESIVAAIDAVRVQHWHHFENKSVAQHLRLNAFLISQELPNACQHERRWCLSRMHPRRNKNGWFFQELERPSRWVPSCLREKALD